MFTISFYVFSAFLSYTDYKYLRVPNPIIIVLFFFLIIYGNIENTLSVYSYLLSFLVIVFFSILILLNKKMALGGGDIKYMALIALFLNPLVFAYFLIITGLVQSLQLIFAKLFLNKQEIYMVPSMFLSVILAEILNFFGFIPSI